MVKVATDQSLRLGFTRARAGMARERYRMALGAVLLIEGAGLAALILWPASLARMLDLPDAPATLRFAALAGLLLVLLLWTGRREPSRTKLTNLIGMAARAALGLVLLFAGGMIGWAGAAELAAAAILALLYFSYFEAEVMTRP